MQLTEIHQHIVHSQIFSEILSDFVKILVPT